MKTKMTLMRARRLRLGLSQLQLSQLSGLHTADISRIESGRLRPYSGQAARLAKALGVSADRLTDLVSRAA